MRKRTIWLLGLVALIGGGLTMSRYLPPAGPDLSLVPGGIGGDISEIRAALTSPLSAELARRELRFGAPVFIRIFKEEAELELWVRQDGRFVLFKTYPICKFSGTLGPKLREGDRQAPEGIYRVGRGALNPNSSFHLSFNLGFPNAYDRANGRTGSFLMVHGACVSVGCYAMTDPAIEEIYLLVEAALLQGQGGVDVHAFPFRMTRARMARAQGDEWFTFWSDLKPVFDHFEKTGNLPQVTSSDGRYRIAGQQRP